MRLIGKILQPSGQITDVTFQNSDPSEKDLLNAIGSPENYVTLGRVDNWEVLAPAPYEKGKETKFLVIGAPPNIDSDPKLRRSCDLNDEQVVQLVKSAVQIFS